MPDIWTEVNGPSTTDEGGNPWLTLTESPNIEASPSGWTVPSVQVVASPAFVGANIAERVDAVTARLTEQCTLDRGAT